MNNQKHDDLTLEQCIGKSSQNVYLMIIYIYTSAYIPLYPITYHYHIVGNRNSLCLEFCLCSMAGLDETTVATGEKGDEHRP